MAPCRKRSTSRRIARLGQSRSSARTGRAISFARCCDGSRETVEGCGFSFARTVRFRAEGSTDGSQADHSPAVPFGRAGAAEPATNCAMRQRAARSCSEGVEPPRGCSRQLSAPRALTARSHGAQRFSHRPERRHKRPWARRQAGALSGTARSRESRMLPGNPVPAEGKPGRRTISVADGWFLEGFSLGADTPTLLGAPGQATMEAGTARCSVRARGAAGRARCCGRRRRVLCCVVAGAVGSAARGLRRARPSKRAWTWLRARLSRRNRSRNGRR
jgi:hypothetical protein